MTPTLIWDFDGTLAERRDGWSGALVEALHQDDPASIVTPQHVRAFLHTGFPWHAPERFHPELAAADAWWNALLPVFETALRGVGVPADHAPALASRVRGHYLRADAWFVFEDTVSTLDRLSARGWRHVIFSNHVPELEQIIHALGLDRHIDQVFNSAHIHYEKPHPNAFAHVMKELGPRQKIWMLGDSMKADIAGARAAGIPCILVRKHHADAPQSCATLADAIAVIDAGTPPA